MNKKLKSTDPDILGSFPALRRAAKRARKLAEEGGAPFYVIENGKIVNLNPKVKISKARKRRK